jgi:hypothetical protein
MAIDEKADEKANEKAIAENPLVIAAKEAEKYGFKAADVSSITGSKKTTATRVKRPSVAETIAVICRLCFKMTNSNEKAREYETFILNAALTAGVDREKLLEAQAKVLAGESIAAKEAMEAVERLDKVLESTR